MKLRYLILFLALIAMQGCSSSTSVNPYEFDFTQINSEYSHNVSDIDGVHNLTSGPWANYDITWKDSNGTLDSLAGFPGKVIILSFWNTAPDSAYVNEPILDSVQAVLKDSVVIVSVASYNSTTTVASIEAFVAAHNFRHQIVVDSTQRAQALYFGNISLFVPAAFILKPGGALLNGQFFEDSTSLSQFDSLVRLAYQ
jgi:hypothetical protein